MKSAGGLGLLLSELEDDPVTDSGHADEAAAGVAVGVEFCGEGLVLPIEAELDEAEEDDDDAAGVELAPVVAADPVGLVCIQGHASGLLVLGKPVVLLEPFVASCASTIGAQVI